MKECNEDRCSEEKIEIGIKKWSADGLVKKLTELISEIPNHGNTKVCFSDYEGNSALMEHLAVEYDYESNSILIMCDPNDS